MNSKELQKLDFADSFVKFARGEITKKQFKLKQKQLKDDIVKNYCGNNDYQR